MKTPIEQANEVLRDASGLFPDYDGVNQKFKWMWSSDLWEWVPETDGHDRPIYDYFCSCGKNVDIHEPSCNTLSQPAMRMGKHYLVDENGPLSSYRNMWMLCTLVGGSYIPVMRGTAVVLPPRAAESEYVPASRAVVRMLTEHVLKLKDEEAASREKATRVEIPEFNKFGEMTKVPHKAAAFWKTKDRIKESLRKFNPDGTVGYSGTVKEINP